MKSLLHRLIRHGRLTVATPLGTVSAGQFDPSYPGGLLDIRVRIRKARTVLKIAANPDLYFGESYMDATSASSRAASGS